MAGPVHERSEVLARLTGAAELLAGRIDQSLIPVSGGNIGFAIRGAREGHDVAAITGGFLAKEGSVRCAGPVAFGADDRISRIILTVMKFDPDIRSAAIIRYSDKAFSALSSIFIECAETDPLKHKGNISTMDWAVAACCSGGVPEVIALHGPDSENPVICIFSEEPGILASNIIILSNRIQ
jgi:hydroxymethylpyrimidine/phosphomethylpyrimidine kinase